MQEPQALPVSMVSREASQPRGSRQLDWFQGLERQLSSIPFILAGIRVGLGRALVGIVVGELVGATSGVGHQMAISAATFQTNRLFAGLFMIAGFGVIVTNIVNRLERLRRVDTTTRIA
jgi:ABC-type proline/glycine betaine transport system permease subunit